MPIEATLPSVTITAKRPPSLKVLLTGGGGLVRFEASAPVSESRVSNYEGFNIVHLPTSLWAYRNTNGRHFSITGRLVSRTPNEAKANAGYLTTVRSWLLSDFGNSGAPPPIIFLSAYSNKQINKVPCILLSYNWSFPEEVDYIYNTDEPMPVIGMLTIELEEAYSAEQITEGKWKIKPQSGGSFSTIGVPGSASTGGGGGGGGGGGTGEVGFGNSSTTNPFFESDFSGIASIANSLGFPTLGNALNLDSGAIGNLPSMIGGTLNNVLNSSELSTAAQDAVGYLNNQFISGSSVQGIINSLPVTNYQASFNNPNYSNEGREVPADSFDRGNTTPVPPPPNYD